MASALEAIFDDMMECVICQEEYNNQTKVAKNLSCGHTLCLECAVRLMHMSDDNKVMRCPECRRPHPVEGGAASLPTNMVIARAITAKDELAIGKKVQEMKGHLKSNVGALEERVAYCQKQIETAETIKHEINRSIDVTNSDVTLHIKNSLASTQKIRKMLKADTIGGSLQFILRQVKQFLDYTDLQLKQRETEIHEKIKTIAEESMQDVLKNLKHGMQQALDTTAQTKSLMARHRFTEEEFQSVCQTHKSIISNPPKEARRERIYVKFDSHAASVSEYGTAELKQLTNFF